MKKRLIIAIDYDDTFTADPELWRQVASSIVMRGHDVICVTARREPPDFSREPRLPSGMPIICAGPLWKKHAAAKAGYPVDIWIDDMPGLIEPSRILDFGA